MSTSTVHSQKTPEELINELFNEHSLLIYRAAYRITRRAEDAHDVLQTIFLRLLTHLPEGIFENPGGYLHQAAVNEALTIAKARKRKKEKAVPILIKVDGKEKEHEEIESKAARSQRAGNLREQLQDAITALNPQDVGLLLLYMDGYSDAEIAEMRGETRGAVASKLYRIREKLRNLLNEEPS
jgi:RNA polymerase sigma-70 factor (ECF subfamily)